VTVYSSYPFVTRRRCPPTQSNWPPSAKRYGTMCWSTTTTVSACTNTGYTVHLLQTSYTDMSTNCVDLATGKPGIHFGWTTRRPPCDRSAGLRARLGMTQTMPICETTKSSQVKYNYSAHGSNGSPKGSSVPQHQRGNAFPAGHEATRSVTIDCAQKIPLSTRGEAYPTCCRALWRLTVSPSSAFRSQKNDGGEDGQAAEDEEREVNAVNHFRRGGVEAVGNEERGDQ